MKSFKKQLGTITLSLSLLGVSFTQAQSTFTEWREGNRGTGDWFGVRDRLEEKGIVFSGSWKRTFYSNLDGGLKRSSAYDQEFAFQLQLRDLASVSGLSLTGTARYRDGKNINEKVGASAAFNPSSIQSAKQWRFQQVYLTWESRDFFAQKNLITISGGWQAPYMFFAQQPDSKLFLNNAITQSKGLGANIPFTGTYSALGGYLKIQPTDWAYIQGGLYGAMPGVITADNHGFYFKKTSDLYSLAELGVTPKIGGLPGKYAIGGYRWGIDKKDFKSNSDSSQSGFYLQADQTLYRVDDTDKGLRWFAFFSHSSESNNALPNYFHTGLTYKGLIPTRDTDVLGVAFGYGDYSHDLRSAQRSARLKEQKYEAVLEADYRVQLAKFAFIQPSIQYIIEPNGSGENATVFALHAGFTF